MHAPFQKLLLVSTLGLLCAASPATHAAAYIKIEGVKGEVTGRPVVWHWFATRTDPGQAAGPRVAVGDIDGDGMDPGSVALLLPAVQKVREAAAQWPGTIPVDMDRPLTSTETALLLPAVQKVREAAGALPDPGSASFLDLSSDVDPAVLIGLLLPAVQKVREAAVASMDVVGRPPASDTELFRLLLPATGHASMVADRIPLANRVLPGQLGLPGSDDPNLRFTTRWSMQRGEVTLLMDSAPISAVPEPQTWAMFLGGLGIAAFVRRRRMATEAPVAA